jgi:hypothetical protein
MSYYDGFNQTIERWNSKMEIITQSKHEIVRGCNQTMQKFYSTKYGIKGCKYEILHWI